MLIQLDDRDRRPIYEQIADEVRRAVVAGTLAAGDALPSVRELASRLRVNPNTVQQAYRELEREGLVYARRGQGTFVAADRGDARAERERVATEVGERAWREATQYGLEAEEVVAAIRRAAGATPAPATRRAEGGAG